MFYADIAIRGRDKEHCQDSTYSYYTNDSAFIAVADGLGSHSYSHIGSCRVITILKQKLQNSLLVTHLEITKMPKEDLVRLVDELYQETIKEWKNWVSNQFSEKLDCTFSLVVAINDYVFYRSIGDSILLFSDKESNFLVIQSSDNVRSSFGSTPTLLSFSDGDYKKYNYLDSEKKGIVLSTDGLEDIIIKTADNPLYREVHGWFSEVFYRYYSQPKTFQKIIEKEFVSLYGQTKGDDVGFGYIIFGQDSSRT